MIAPAPTMISEPSKPSVVRSSNRRALSVGTNGRSSANHFSSAAIFTAAPPMPAMNSA